MRKVSPPVHIAGGGARTALRLPSKALSSPFTSIPCQLLCYCVPQASEGWPCGVVVPGSSGMGMLLTPQQVFVPTATSDQMLCGVIPSGGNPPLSAASNCCWADLHSLGREAMSSVGGRSLLWVNRVLPHLHTLHVGPQMSSRAWKEERHNWWKGFFFWGKRNNTFLMTSGTGRGFVNYLSKKMESWSTPWHGVRKLILNRKKNKDDT